MSYFENIKVFLRVVELGNLSAAGRDMRLSPAVASNRVKELEKYLGVRLFNRTTRQLTPTEQGKIFYVGAGRIVKAVEDAEASIASVSGQPKGTIRVTAPLGFGRRFIASGIPEFHDQYPDIMVRLRLSDHNVDMLKESIDLAFRLGVIEDSSLRMRGLMDCERVLCAAPDYFVKHSMPQSIDDLITIACCCAFPAPMNMSGPCRRRTVCARSRSAALLIPMMAMCCWNGRSTATALPAGRASRCRNISNQVSLSRFCQTHRRWRRNWR